MSDLKKMDNFQQVTALVKVKGVEKCQVPDSRWKYDIKIGDKAEVLGLQCGRMKLGRWR